MTDQFDLNHWCAQHLQHVEKALDNWVSVDASADLDHAAPAALMTAMRYAVLDGGKRLRPLLVMAAFEAVSRAGSRPPLTVSAADQELALRAACSVELIHAYSLVHDDMPCMDNDVLRRGKPTVHVEFGSASALLAGDALQALAFELLTPDELAVPAARQASLCRLLARAAGCAGMAGGQAIDLASVGLSLSEDQLREMHQLKTGALLQASVMMGATCGDATAQAVQALQAYGAAVGLAFQVVDDILDVTADSATLGKTAGKDQAQDKPTYVSLMGLEPARHYAQTLYQQALAALAASGLPDTRALQGLASLLVQRSS
jgi:farnesyl diphosphate synthase